MAFNKNFLKRRITLRINHSIIIYWILQSTKWNKLVIWNGSIEFARYKRSYYIFVYFSIAFQTPLLVHYNSKAIRRIARNRFKQFCESKRFFFSLSNLHYNYFSTGLYGFGKTTDAIMSGRIVLINEDFDALSNS